MRCLLAVLVLLVSLPVAAQQRVVLVGDSLSTDEAISACGAGHYLAARFLVYVLGVGATSSGDGAGEGNGTSVADRITAGEIVAGDIVVLMYGTNDFRHEDGIPDTSLAAATAKTAANMVAMAATVTAAGAHPVIAAPPPCILDTDSCVVAGDSFNRAPYIDAIAPLLRTAAATAGVTFADPWTAFDDIAQDLSTLLQSGDSVHPNASGTYLLWTTVNAVLEPLVPPWSTVMRP